MGGGGGGGGGFFFNDTATTEIYTLSLHDALPIYMGLGREDDAAVAKVYAQEAGLTLPDPKS